MADGFLLQMLRLAVMKKKVFVVYRSQFFEHSHPYPPSCNSEVRARRLSCRKQLWLLSQCFYYYKKNCRGLIKHSFHKGLCFCEHYCLSESLWQVVVEYHEEIWYLKPNPCWAIWISKINPDFFRDCVLSNFILRFKSTDSTCILYRFLLLQISDSGWNRRAWHQDLSPAWCWIRWGWRF